MEQNIQNMNVKYIDPLHFTFPLKLRDHVLTREMLHITLLSYFADINQPNKIKVR